MTGCANDATRPGRVKAMAGPLRSARHRLRRMRPARAAYASSCSLAAVVARGRRRAATRRPRSRPPPVVPGSSRAPREVNLITKDYSFLPDALDLVPGETVLLHVINGGLEVHEAVIGDVAVQDAWEVAEAATDGAPPGPTPVVSVPPDVAGLRIVVHSGERVDVVWTVPPRDGRAPVHRRLPHPRPLGAGDADPRPGDPIGHAASAPSEASAVVRSRPAPAGRALCAGRQTSRRILEWPT